VEEDGKCGLRARDGEREPKGRVALALPEQFEGGFKEPGGGVGGEAVEQVKSELTDADALDRLAGQLCGVCGGRVEVAADVEDDAAAIEVERLDEQMVDDARGLAGAGLAENRDVLGRVAEVEGDVRAALQSSGVAKCGERASRLTDPEAEVPRLAEIRANGRCGIDFFAQWEGRERLAVDCAHQWAKTEPPTTAAPARVTSPCESG